MEDKLKVGFGFRPFEDEVVGYYLRRKILGQILADEDFIRELDICSLDPWDLRWESTVESRDHAWYFYSRRENNYASGTQQRRQTDSGFWKLTGNPVPITDQCGIWSGVPGGVIGFKRFSGFRKGTAKENVKTEWSMHEFHCTLLPESRRTYVICKLEYKGKDKSIILGNLTDPMTDSPASVVDQPLQGSFNHFPEVVGPVDQAQWSYPGLSDMQQSFQANSGYLPELGSANQVPWLSNDFNLQQQDPYLATHGDEFQKIWNSMVAENIEYLVDERTLMEENYNIHRPKRPVTGVVAGNSSDSDTDSMICGDTSSSTGSVGSSSGSSQTSRDEILSLSTTAPSIGREEQPKQLKLHVQGKEKVIDTQKSEPEWKRAEDSVKKAPSTVLVKQSWIVLEEMSQRKSQWNYLKNMIIGVLVLISIIGWIILVG